MLRLFNKFIPIVVGVLTAAIFAACSDEKETVILENGLCKDDSHPYGMCYSSDRNGFVICGPECFITKGICSFDKNADSYVLTPVTISDMPVEKLKPFASTPILLPNEIVEKLDTTQKMVTVMYDQNRYLITPTVINGRTYQTVNFAWEYYNTLSGSRSSERVFEDCATPDSCILSPAPDFLLSRSSDTSHLHCRLA